MTVGEIIHKRRKECKMTLEELGEYIGVSKQTVQRYESGVISNIPGEKIEQMARALSTSPAALMGWEEMRDLSPEGDFPVTQAHKHSREAPLPILGKIACGEPIFADGHSHQDVLLSDFFPQADFCLVAKGDSMIGARIFDGDIVFIRSQESVDNGEIAAVIIEDEATLKRVYYYPKEKKLILTPENKKYAPLVYVGRELQQVRILGLAVAFQSKVQ